MTTGKNWKVLIYNYDDHIIDCWYFNDMTEQQARDNAARDVIKEYPYTTWTLMEAIK